MLYLELRLLFQFIYWDSKTIHVTYDVVRHFRYFQIWSMVVPPHQSEQFSVYFNTL